MKKRSPSVWDIIAWVVLFLILVWLILRVGGLINTPVLLEYSPVFGAVYLAGWAMNKLNQAAEDIGEFKQFNRQTIKEIQHIKLNCVKNHRR